LQALAFHRQQQQSQVWSCPKSFKINLYLNSKFKILYFLHQNLSVDKSLTCAKGVSYKQCVFPLHSLFVNLYNSITFLSKLIFKSPMKLNPRYVDAHILYPVGSIVVCSGVYYQSTSHSLKHTKQR
jgi:hypothetical protein